VSFSLILNGLRVKKNFTQKQLSDELGLKVSTISGYERGGSTPNYEVLLKIADYFGVSLDSLTGHQIVDLQANFNDDPYTVSVYPYVANAGAIAEYSQEYVGKNLRKISLFGMAKLGSMAFRVEGESMEPKFPNGCLVVCEKAGLSALVSSQATVLVCREAVYLKQVVLGFDKLVELHSINKDEAKSFKITEEDIREVWLPYIVIRAL
jgi:transcriptional regulator with XRE-family HTH domain